MWTQNWQCDNLHVAKLHICSYLYSDLFVITVVVLLIFSSSPLHFLTSFTHSVQSVRWYECSDLRSCMCLFIFRYFLQPRENGGKSVKVEELGSLRLNIVYTEDHVFPSEHYTPLRDLLLQSADVGVCAYGHLPLCSDHCLVLFYIVFTPVCSARVSVHSSYSGWGVSRETRSCHPPCASVSSLRQDSAFHQHHRSRRN